jgi:hypothetical protein
MVGQTKPRILSSKKRLAGTASSADCIDIDVVARLMGNHRSQARLIWTDPTVGVDYRAKNDWADQHGDGPRRRAIENDLLTPAELQKLFAAGAEVARQYAMPGVALYATVPSLFLKNFLQGFEDDGFS